MPKYKLQKTEKAQTIICIDSDSDSEKAEIKPVTQRVVRKLKNQTTKREFSQADTPLSDIEVENANEATKMLKVSSPRKQKSPPPRKQNSPPPRKQKSPPRKQKSPPPRKQKSPPRKLGLAAPETTSARKMKRVKPKVFLEEELEGEWDKKSNSPAVSEITYIDRPVSVLSDSPKPKIDAKKSGRLNGDASPRSPKDSGMGKNDIKLYTKAICVGNSIFFPEGNDKVVSFLPSLLQFVFNSQEVKLNYQIISNWFVSTPPLPSALYFPSISSFLSLLFPFSSLLFLKFLFLSPLMRMLLSFQLIVNGKL